MNYKPLFKPPETNFLKAGQVSLQPGESIGEHTTTNREEILIILRGTATLTLENQTLELKQGQTHYIPPEKKHNVTNNSKQELEYIYVVNLLGELFK